MTDQPPRLTGLTKLQAIEQAKTNAKRWGARYCVFAVDPGTPHERWCGYLTTRPRTDKHNPSDLMIEKEGTVS